MSPEEALRGRKKFVSPGVFLEGAKIPGEKKIHRTIKDTLTPDLIEAQVAMCLDIFSSSVLDPSFAMNVAKRYKEPMDKILLMFKPIRHFVSTISPLMLPQLSLFNNFDTKSDKDICFR